MNQHRFADNIISRVRRSPLFSVISYRPALQHLTIRTCVLILSLPVFSALSAENYFDPALLNLPAGTDPEQIDLSAFSQPGKIPAGRYVVSLSVNREDTGQREIEFTTDRQGNVTPHITPALLGESGVNIAAIPQLKVLAQDTKIEDLPAVIPGARVEFDMAKLRLNLSIPQVAMRPDYRGYIDPALLDQGIAALLLNYQVNAGRQWFRGGNVTSKSQNNNEFANLNGGINLGVWRLRSTFTYSNSETTIAGRVTRAVNTHFSNTYIMRDLQKWGAELLAGESSTGNTVFDSIPFKGVKIATNEQMLPAGLRGFAPDIRGTAQSNARITIRQNGNVIYQTYVAPGPFNIKDLYATGSAGDLEVTITEEDGTTRTFTQAFSGLPVMLRPSGMKYEITAGQYNGGITAGSKTADFVQATLIYGLPHSVTLYGGGLAAKQYKTVMAGAGISLGKFGAFSADITHASAQLPDVTAKGQSYRLRYSKNLLETGTSIDLTALRYSTENYYSFADFNQAGYQLKNDVAPWLAARRRSSFQTYINQSLGDMGSIYLQGTRDNYWGTEQTVTSLGAGYSNSFRGVNYNLDYSISRTQGDNSWPENRQISLSVSVPFSIFSHQPLLQDIQSSFQITRDNHGRTYQQAGLNGRLSDDKLSWQLTESGDNQAHQSSTLNLGYQGERGYLGGGYSYGNDYSAVNLNASGGVVLHRGGLTLSRYMGSSVAVIEAPDAAGATLNGGSATFGTGGYAVVPYLTDYSRNTVNLDINTLPDNVTSQETSVNLYPTKGAVVKTTFKTRKGYQALITLQSNTVIPFGAVAAVTGETGKNDIQTEQNTGIVGDNGQVYLSGLPETGSVQVKWGNEISQQCHGTFNLADVPDNPYSPIRQLTVSCHITAETLR